jgi:hypothetical protein
METPPKPESLRTVPFVTHATRGILRDQRSRRRAMLVVIAIAALMVISGSTFLRPIIDAREHLLWFLLFWLGCAWFTFTALLLALFDVLLVRAQARKAQRELRETALGKSRDESVAADTDK